MHRAQNSASLPLRPTWLSQTGAAALAVAILVVPATGFAKDHELTTVGSGCAPDRPAVPHHAGGELASRGNDQTAPIPCATTTAYRTNEISIIVTNNGTVLFEPALKTEATGLPVGVLRSVDEGQSWNFIDPSTTPARTSGNDMNMWIDRDTGRVFWSNSLGSIIPG